MLGKSMRIGWVMLLAGAWGAGCTLGPSAVRSSSDGYNRAIRQTADEQLLLNVVRLKYRDAPFFLETGSISAQFTFGSSVNLAGRIFENVGATNAPNVLDLWGSVRYDDKPTITYTPLHGEDFVRRLMSPLKLETLMQLFYSGWSVDRILRLTVQRINGLDNAVTASGPTPEVAPKFREFAEVTRRLRALQQAGLLEMGTESRPVALGDPIAAGHVSGADLVEAARAGYEFVRTDDLERYVLMGSEDKAVLYLDNEAMQRADVDKITELLRLEPGRASYELKQTLAVKSPDAEQGYDSLAINTRSLIGAMFYLSQGVEAPERHVEQGLVTVTRDERGQRFDWSAVTGDLMRVRSQSRRPTGAAVAVRYRGPWFYIDDADLTSKSTFALLGQLFNLQAGDSRGVAPVLTIPVGG